MDAHPAGPCPANLVFEMPAVIVAALYNETGVAMFGGIKIPSRKGFGGAGIDALSAIIALAFDRLARLQRGIG